MYSNFTFTTAGELSAVIGIHKNTNDPIALSTYTDLDNLRITAAQQKVQYVLDLVEPSKIIFDDFEPEENSLISTLSYNTMGSVSAIVNKRLSTAAKRREDSTLRTRKWDLIIHQICLELPSLGSVRNKFLFFKSHLA